MSDSNASDSKTTADAAAAELDKRARLAVKLTLGNMAMEGLAVSPECRAHLLVMARELLGGVADKK